MTIETHYWTVIDAENIRIGYRLIYLGSLYEVDSVHDGHYNSVITRLRGLSKEARESKVQAFIKDTRVAITVPSLFALDEQHYFDFTMKECDV